VGGGVYLYFHPAFGQPIILGQPSDLLSRYQSAPLIPGPGRFRSEFTQATVIVYEDDSVVATLAVGKLPSQYGHAVIRSSATRRASCARAQYQIGNLGGVVPAQLVLPVRYRDGIASATFYNRGGYLMGDVPLRESQAAVALPNEMISAAQRHDLVVTIRIFNNQGQEARLNYLPAENQLNAIGLPMELVYFEGHRDLEDAIRREKYFKTTKGKVTLRQIMRNALENKNII
jgi:hypothetical protein